MSKILDIAYKDAKNRTIIPVRKFYAIDDECKVNETEPSTLQILIVEEQRRETISYSDFKKYKENGLLKQIVI